MTTLICSTITVPCNSQENTHDTKTGGWGREAGLAMRNAQSECRGGATGGENMTESELGGRVLWFRVNG